jgi:hypothetical protein
LKRMSAMVTKEQIKAEKFEVERAEREDAVSKYLKKTETVTIRAGAKATGDATMAPGSKTVVAVEV